MKIDLNIDKALENLKNNNLTKVMDKISSDIKKVEQSIISNGLNIDFKYMIENVIDPKFLYWSHNRKRIIYEDKNETKFFGETKINTRLENIKYLVPFIEAFKNHLDDMLG